MRWAYLSEWRAWWIMRSEGVTVQRLYGPFRGAEVAAAADLHRLPQALTG